jgi:hypothetical protein
MSTKRVTFVESEYTVTELDANVTLSDVNKDVEGVAVELKVPRKTVMVIRPSDVLAFYAKDNGTTPTELPNAMSMRLRHTDPNEIVKNDLATLQYELTKEFRNRDTIFRLGIAAKRLNEDTKLQLLIKPTNLSTGATKADKTTYRLRLTCLRVAEVIPL